MKKIPRNLQKKIPLESIDELNKVARYKANTQKLIVLLYTSNEQQETKNLKQKPQFFIALKNEIIAINTMKHAQYLFV